MTEEIWVIRKVVTRNGVCAVEKVEDEKPFFSKEDCQKRVRELNGGEPDGPYLCEEVSVLTR